MSDGNEQHVTAAPPTGADAAGATAAGAPTEGAPAEEAPAAAASPAEASSAGASSGESSTAQAPRPGDPVARELAAVADAMEQVRTADRAAGETPTVPGEEEVAALEHAHEVLRATLDRVDRGG